MKRVAETSLALVRIHRILRDNLVPKKRTRLETFYHRVSVFTKYVGIPSLILGSILPVYQLSKNITDGLNTEYLRRIYIDYANQIASTGDSQRARHVIANLEKVKDFDARAAYTAAKILAFDTAQRGQHYETAEDSIRVLLKISENRPFLFPDVIDQQGIVELKLALVDMGLENGRSQEVKSLLFDLVRDNESRPLPAQVKVKLRQAAFYTLEHNYQPSLEQIEIVLKQTKDARSQDAILVEGDALFQKGKLFQFQNLHDRALESYLAARANYAKSGDNYRLIKVLNNIGNVLGYQGNTQQAINVYEEELAIARRLNHDTAKGRSLLNISTQYQRLGKLESALRLGLEANAIFKELGNQLALATSLENLLVLSKKRKEFENAFRYGEESLEYFTRVQDLRGLGNVAGFLGDICRELNLMHDAVYYNVLTAILQRHEKRDYKLPVLKSIILSLKNELGEKFNDELQLAFAKIDVVKARLERSDINYSIDEFLK